MRPERLRPGTVVELKKKHPCGGTRWEVLRGGVDIKARCTTCDRIVTLPRKKFTRSIKHIINDDPES
ncbi:MAG: DUF951 domain-containing protein [Armatimonadota bacterium]